DQHTERRDQPDHGHDQDRDPHEPPALADADRLGPGSLRRLLGLEVDLVDGGCEAHRTASCSRKRRTFQTITGMTARNKTTAIAAPRPSWLLMKNHRIMRSATTSVPLVSALPITNTMSKTFIALMIM